jgi:hypothetical protein
MWECECDCGKTRIVSGDTLRLGNATSCGCAAIERITALKYKDGRCKDRLHGVWRNMKNRCYRKNTTHYKYYGERGIKICDEWLEYANFKKWAHENGYDENAPKGTYTIERIDVNGNYEPMNCKWISSEEQSKNRRSNYRVTFDGITTTLSDFARMFGLNYSTMVSRVYAGTFDLMRINGKQIKITRDYKNGT